MCDMNIPAVHRQPRSQVVHWLFLMSVLEPWSHFHIGVDTRQAEKRKEQKLIYFKQIKNINGGGC